MASQKKNASIRPKIEKGTEQAFLKQLNQLIEANLDNDTFTVYTLAQHLNMSESTLLRKVKQLTRLTPIQYIQEFRLNRGMELLESKHYSSIVKVAYMVGYKDLRSFSRLFKKRFGKYPSDI